METGEPREVGAPDRSPAGNPCPHCDLAVDAGASASFGCPACGSVQHEDCWAAAGGCGVCACGKTAGGEPPGSGAGSRGDGAFKDPAAASALACQVLALVWVLIGTPVVPIAPLLIGAAILLAALGFLTDRSRTPAVLVLLITLPVLVIMSPGLHSRDFLRTARARGCEANRRTLDKLVGVWESQHTGIPRDRDVFVTFDARGRMVDVDPDLQQLSRKTPAPLVPGSTALLRLSKDPNLFLCPVRVAEPWFGEIDRDAEHHFRWVSGPGWARELRDRRGDPDPLRRSSPSGVDRGTLCLAHREEP